MVTVEGQSVEHIIVAIRERWGHKSVTRLSDLAAFPVHPTGYANLDDFLSGGLPLGRISEFVGKPTSGKTTVALGAAKETQDTIVLYLDPAKRADPDYILRMGISKRDFLLVRTSITQTLSLLRDVVATRIPSFIVFDVPEYLSQREHSLLSHALHVSKPILIQTASIVLILLSATSHEQMQARGSHLSVLFRHEEWLHKEGEVIGSRVKVSKLRQQSGSSTGTVSFDVMFPDSF